MQNKHHRSQIKFMIYHQKSKWKHFCLLFSIFILNNSFEVNYHWLISFLQLAHSLKIFPCAKCDCFSVNEWTVRLNTTFCKQARGAYQRALIWRNKWKWFLRLTEFEESYGLLIKYILYCKSIDNVMLHLLMWHSVSGLALVLEDWTEFGHELDRPKT